MVREGDDWRIRSRGVQRGEEAAGRRDGVERACFALRGRLCRSHRLALGQTPDGSSRRLVLARIGIDKDLLLRSAGQGGDDALLGGGWLKDALVGRELGG